MVNISDSSEKPAELGDQSLRVLIACGGTGGHLFPGVAVAQKLKERGHQPLLLISRKGVDSTASSSYPELNFVSVPTIARPPLMSLQVFSFISKLIKAQSQAKRLLREWQPQVVLGMGGFTALLPVRAAARRGVGSAIHDSNAVPGKANRLLGRQVDRVMLGLEACAEYFPEAQIAVTGTPVRSELHHLPSQAEARAKFGLDPQAPTVLITGGSQGAQALNESTKRALPVYAREGFQLIHLCGRGNQEELRAAAERAGVRAAIYDFWADMPAAYAAADLVVARAGASTLSELAVTGKPSILVPFPFAADDHQSKNAEAFASRGAALHLPQRDLGDGSLMRVVLAHLGDLSLRRQMIESLSELRIDDAADEIVSVLEQIAAEKG